jgi:uncharacterized protein (TIGR01777 family)
MIIAITGAGGLIGQRIQHDLTDICPEFLVLSRGEPVEAWRNKISRADVVINLAGHPILCRWHKANRMKILDSRVRTIQQVVSILNELPQESSAKLFISASAIGIYPDNATLPFQENAIETGNNFLSEVVVKWEAETNRLTNKKIRTVIMRLGVVLGKESAMIKQLLPLFKLGLGGKIGHGKQMMSFIHIEDLMNAIRFFIQNNEAEGIYNIVAPNPVSNAHFTKVFSRLVNRPALFTVPSIMLKLVYGESSRILTKGSAVFPKRLIQQNFEFNYPRIEHALQEICAE